MGDKTVPMEVETKIQGEDVRVSVARGNREFGTLAFNRETICWIPAQAEQDGDAEPQRTWLMPWGQFAAAMQSVDLGDIVRFDQSAYVPANRVAAPKVDATYGSPMPEMREKLELKRRFNAAEFALIRKGFPPDWDAKWGISFDTLRHELRMCRSWTGMCIYLLIFHEDSDGAEIAESWVNRDPEQYQETDTQHDAEVASWLIDVRLLDRNREFPSRRN